MSERQLLIAFGIVVSFLFCSVFAAGILYNLDFSTSAAQPTNPPLPTPEPTNTPEPPTFIPEPTATPEPTKQLTFPPSPADTPILEPTTTKVTGLGISRTNAALLYKIFEFKFELIADEQRYTGTIADNLAIVELVGPEENITYASITIEIPKPPTESQASRTLVYLSALLTLEDQAGEQAANWLIDSLNTEGESRAIFGNRENVLIVTYDVDKTIVKFTVRQSFIP